jgi:hypothetical protein
MGGDGQSKKESECKKPPRQRGVELLIDKAQSTRRVKWEGNKGSKEGDQKIKAQDKILSGSPLGKMLKYWDDSPHTIGKNKQRMVKYCCFIWTQEPILKPLVFLAKIWV